MSFLHVSHLWVSTLVAFALGQTAAQVKELYQQGQYELVISVTDSLLRDSTAADRIEVMKYRAFALIARGRTDIARQIFNEILTRDPLATLDPRTVSPKIVNIFEEVRRSRVWLAPVKVRVETLRVRPSTKSIMLSFVYPGVGQVCRRRKIAGWSLIGGETIALSGLVASSIIFDAAHDQYQAETNPELIPEKYDRANRWYRIRIGFISTACLVYLYSIIDAARHL